MFCGILLKVTPKKQSINNIIIVIYNKKANVRNMKIKDSNEKYTLDELYEIIRVLRSPEGCPWDREQTHESLVKPMIEEAYEAVDAINSGNKDKLIEELGDVLLQVIFHSIIAEENSEFEFEDVTDKCARKMIFRHTHVFGDVVANNPKEALANWEKMKIKEKEISSLYEELKDIPKNLPALMRAEKVARKIRKAGHRKEGQDVEIDFSDSKSVGAMLYSICAIAEEKGIDPFIALTNVLEEKIEQHKCL